MKLFLIVAVVAVVAALALPVNAQLAPVVDPEIKKAVEQVSAQRLEKDVRKLASFGTRHTQSDTRHPSRGIGAARRWLKKELEAIAGQTGSRIKVSFEKHAYPSSRSLRGGAEVVNVVGTLPGTDKDRYVIVSGHYDSRASRGSDAKSDAPGADDDASGSACVLECARVMGHMKTRATVIFLVTAAEEQGLLGARGHAKLARKERRRVEGFITNDIIGGVKGSSGKRELGRVRLFSEGRPSGPKMRSGRTLGRITGSDNDASSRQLARYLKARGEVYVPNFEVTLIFRQDRYNRGGDHRAFNDEGFPGVRFTEVHENYDQQHQNVRVENGRRYGDLPEHLDYEYVKRVTQVNAVGVMELSLAPASPQRVQMVTRGLTPHTELRWEANSERDLAGYAVLYRRTHEPTWTHRREMPRGETRVVMEGLSKDDWYFAVQAVDRNGHRSVPVYPRPGR